MKRTVLVPECQRGAVFLTVGWMKNNVPGEVMRAGSQGSRLHIVLCMLLL